MTSLITIFALLLISSVEADDEKIVIAVAANMQFAIREITEAFEENSTQKVDIVVGSSGKLTAQIKNGAPFDLFLSADMKYPRELLQSGHGKQLKVYAFGTLVLVSKRPFEFDDGIKTLKKNEVKRIAIADPELAPYGRESINALKHYQLYDAVKEKLVFGKSIAQVGLYLESGSVEVGLLAKSAVLSPRLRERMTWIEVNPESYEPLEQGVVILQHGWTQNQSASESFYEFLFSKRAKEILLRYGYRFDE